MNKLIVSIALVIGLVGVSQAGSKTDIETPAFDKAIAQQMIQASIQRFEIATRPGLRDARGEHVARQIRSFLQLPVERVRSRDVYRVEGDLATDEPERIVRELTDPILQVGALNRVTDEPADAVITVGFKPGVADPIGRSAKLAIEDTLGRKLGEQATVFSSVMYLLDGISNDDAERVALELIGNPVIHEIEVMTGGQL